MTSLLALSLAAGLSATGCEAKLSITGAGEAGEASGEGSGSQSDEVPHHGDRYSAPGNASEGGIKRLAPREYDAALRDLLDLGSDYGRTYLPDIGGYFFDNDFTSYSAQNPSSALVDSLELIAREVAADTSSRIADDPDYRDRIVGCDLAAEGESCYRSFVERFGRRALRRPIEPAEVDTLVARFWNLDDVDEDARALATETHRMQFTLEYFLQHPEFLYRDEQGTPVEGLPGVYALDDFAIASRLSFFLWGTIPSHDLLDRAERGELSTPEQVRTVAAEMLQDPRAAAQMELFHAMWLGYRNSPLPAELREDAIAESEALVRRVVEPGAGVDWRTLFTSNETYINQALAEHYDMSWEGGDGFAWVEYPADVPRAGLLSHAAFLSLGTQGEETSIIFRGVNLLERVIQCRELHPPDLDKIEKGEPMEPKSNCEIDLVNADTLPGGCGSCHYQINYMGGALEGFDAQGRYRPSYPDQPECEIPEGAVMRPASDGWAPAHTFDGPAGLGRLLVEEPDMGFEICAVGKLYEFAVGYENPSADDRPTIETLASSFAASGYHFDELVLDLVASPAFRYRTDLAAATPNH